MIRLDLVTLYIRLSKWNINIDSVLEKMELDNQIPKSNK